jgi:3'-5' exoribonuclease
MELLTISQLKRAAGDGRVEAIVHAQIETIARKDASNGKPYLEVTFNDGEAKFTLKAWNDSPGFSYCERGVVGSFVEIAGEFATSKFGMESAGWRLRDLRAEEKEALLSGPPELREKQAADFAYIDSTTAAIGDPRLASLCRIFLTEYGDRYRRAAAARNNHHARRGGLVEHVAQMMRSAVAIATAYPDLNKDLMVAGVLFHDAGKIWENGLPADGFTMPYSEAGELLGHITIGIELVNTLWRKLAATDDWRAWVSLEPSNEDVRMHLLHLVASHHGELQFGSPVTPRTPEAWALHYVDNLDARIEMITAAYKTSKQLAPRIQEKVWPLAGNIVQPLAHFQRPATN